MNETVTFPSYSEDEWDYEEPETHRSINREYAINDEGKSKPKRLCINKAFIHRTYKFDLSYFQWNLLIEGYMREFIKNIHVSMQISMEQFKKIIFEYCCILIMKFYRDRLKPARWLKYIGGTIIIKHAFDGVQNTVLFGKQISKYMCNIFKINIKSNKLQSYIYIGYLLSNLYENDNLSFPSIPEWDKPIGRDENAKYSVGFYIYKHSKRFRLCDKSRCCQQLTTYESKDKFKSGDIFTLQFNFESNKLLLYHNDNFAFKMDLNTEYITIACTLSGCDGEEIQVISYQIDDKKWILDKPKNNNISPQRAPLDWLVTRKSNF